MKKIPDEEIIGKKYNKLTAIKFEGTKFNKRYFRFLCDCGNETVANLSAVMNGRIKSCGKCRGKHRLSYTRLYKIWHGIKSRCYCKTCAAFPNYGEKGITMYEGWINNPEEFYNWSINNGYKDNLTIDRIDSSKGYFPDNCRWATYAEQNSHLRMLKTNKSGYKGVSWSKTCKKWLCVISINNKSKRIGIYKTQKEAVEARNKFIDENKLIYHQKNKYIGELSNGY